MRKGSDNIKTSFGKRRGGKAKKFLSQRDKKVSKNRGQG